MRFITRFRLLDQFQLAHMTSGTQLHFGAGKYADLTQRKPLFKLMFTFAFCGHKGFIFQLKYPLRMFQNVLGNFSAL